MLLVIPLLVSPLLVLPQQAAHAAVAEAELTRLSGPTRYSTSVQIAEAYMDAIDDLPDTSRVDTVIMGSGLDEHTGWITPVPMLSRLHRAPLVFTRPDEVPTPVVQFLQRHQIRRVILLGGTQVISAAVERQLAGLGVEVVERLGNDEVHLHSVDIAESFNNPVGAAAVSVETALLTTSNAFADALAAGPMAYQGNYPILLTPQDQLHPAVFDYLVASDIERLIIVGGTAAVGTAVQQALSGLDFRITRIAGNDRYATAIELAETQLGGDGLRTCYDGAELGLAFGGLSPDAIASGPLLGERCAPLLLTPADTLPRTVASFLRSDKWVTGDADNQLAVTVFGGLAAVPADIVTQFVDRATTLVPIGGRIGVTLDPDTEQTREFTVGFEGDVDPKLLAKALDPEFAMFTVNYERVFPISSCDSQLDELDEDAPAGLLCGRVRVRGNSITVELWRGRETTTPGQVEREAENLEVDDLITVTGGQRIGLNNSPRPVARFSYLIGEPEEPEDRDAPEVEIVAPVGHNRIALLVIEANPFNAAAAAAGLAARVTVIAADGSTKALSSDTVVHTSRPDSGTRAPHDRYVLTLDDDETLEVDDAITVPRGLFLDKDGRRNPLHHVVVRDRSKDFRIESVTVGDVKTDAQASVILEVTDARDTQLDADPSGRLTITARRDGIAAGSRGNEWRVYGNALPSTDGGSIAEREPEIGVEINQSLRVIRYRILVGEPTFADLAVALAADATFAANFTAEATGVGSDSTTIGGTVTAGVPFNGGGTAVGVRVRFSDPVKSLVGVPEAPNASNCLPTRLRRDIAPRLNNTGTVDRCTLSFDAPDNLVFMKLTSPSTARLPRQGDLVFINGGAANAYADDPSDDRPSVAQGWLSIRYDPDVVVD